MFNETVVFASKFQSKKGETYTRLFVPIGQEVVDVLVKGDKTALAGVECPFRLYVKDGQIKLQLAMESEV